MGTGQKLPLRCPKEDRSPAGCLSRNQLSTPGWGLGSAPFGFGLLLVDVPVALREAGPGTPVKGTCPEQPEHQRAHPREEPSSPAGDLGASTRPAGPGTSAHPMGEPQLFPPESSQRLHQPQRSHQDQPPALSWWEAGNAQTRDPHPPPWAAQAGRVSSGQSEGPSWGTNTSALHSSSPTRPLQKSPGLLLLSSVLLWLWKYLK